ncbi:formyltetrahydrofolate deformylase [Mucilaginibacter aquatilis]|uniref:Formyltetrahydrofolate deformylase n=1 Tax=Mucilaginibacter aquatilis TaxID=1517760 RepID=A0A6I4I9K3_9SPHI|nr:formyltetrahydrofolate deformylase [Mucilaginibacter aquatilis]MVN90146.1 formyltetrahydrofolate deformylase [Mucilaginibacter aquatilis]
MIIIIQCRDRVGLVSAISGAMSKAGLNIINMDEYVDKAENRFFVRLNVEQPEGTGLHEDDLKPLLPDDAIVTINPSPEKKIVVMVTKEYHCLADILVRNYFKTLGATVQAVIGNHNVLEDICRRFGIPFHYITHEQETKGQFEAAIADTINNYNPDYVVLAKFMRILSPEFVARFPMRVINIHHSFLPAFIGANPYRQAYNRGVKIIGATAHFVTNDLDEGPIISQQTIHVNHTYTAQDMMKAGREVETSVLANALQLVLHDRVFVYKNKTVVFE